MNTPARQLVFGDDGSAAADVMRQSNFCPFSLSLPRGSPQLLNDFICNNNLRRMQCLYNLCVPFNSSIT